MAATTNGALPANLGAFYLEHYRTVFRASLAAGEARPLVIPFSILGSFVLPVLYLSIPHRKRPWLYQARFAVAAALVALNLQTIASTSSTQMAFAYGAGLMASWCTMWSLTLLLFMRPQFEAARIERRLRKSSSIPPQKAPDESLAKVAAHHEHYWQPFPEDGSLLQRLSWTYDLFMALRGEPVNLDAMPTTTRAGYHRSLTYRSFLRNRLFHIAWAWLALDIWTVTARRDPYFVLGPDYTTAVPSHPLPAALSALPLPLLELVRSLFGLVGILAGLFFYMNCYQLMLCCVLGQRLLGVRADLWQHPSIFGSFDNVLDRGLGGFWSGWWHQTFRVAFVAPTAWLAGHQKGSGGLLGSMPMLAKVLVLFVAFFQSGLLHAAGGYTSVPETTRVWYPMAFFLLSFVGIVVQTAVCGVFRRQIGEKVSRGWRRAGNLVFAALWLHYTRWAVIDDMSRAALWLIEPVPVSPLRLMGLGLGLPGESWWRWDMEYLPTWYRGAHWWESGIRL
ncbi:hypothetical protein B0T17DRAFT_643931 [Bombardia bombarda]|uniref:Wax synthase domain-containing protein n=1 Tax=Bombardia bombarda TaxID=252184 RepID=A0AA39WN08_9PEZI|nr:hypothetical protein B0T17DRAFT_643931 [Bombardia bombarda]